MAHFVNVSTGQPISQLLVPRGQTVEVGVWGPIDYTSTREEVNVVPDDPFVSTKKKPYIKNNVRTWYIKGKNIGKTVLNAKIGGTPFAAPLNVEVCECMAWGNHGGTGSSCNHIFCRPPVKISPEFKRKVIEICKGVGVNPSHLMACMHSESGIKPQQKNEQNGQLLAVGLIQFTNQSGVGIDLKALFNMTALQQLDYVGKYFARPGIRGQATTVEQVYTAMAWPAALKEADDFIFIRKDAQPTLYQQNVGLDANKDGKITKHELGGLARHHLRWGLMPGNVG